MNTPVSAVPVAGIPINPDAAIHTLDDDRLDRKDFAKTIAGRIRLAGHGASVVFGLTGPWGSGKTSALRMITDAMQAPDSPTWSVVEFTPWAADSGPSLIEEFYQSIAAAMPTGEKGEKAKEALRAAAPVAGAMIKAAGTALLEKYLGDGSVQNIGKAGADAFADKIGEIRAGSEPDPFATRFAAISRAIREADTNVLVIVDDIDRLHANELLSVLKAVRLLGRFDRVHYMLSYDEETVLGVLKATDIASNDVRRAQKYLEKIVQYPFALPPIQQVHLARELRTQLSAVAASHGGPEMGAHTTDEADTHHPVFGAQSEDDDLADLLFAALPTDRMNLRSIYRLCNQLDILLTLAGGASELDFYDATLITYLRLHYPALYTQIPRWRKDLLSNAALWGVTTQPTAEEKQNQIAEYTESTNTADHQIAYVILARLFPRTLPKPKGMYIPERPDVCRIGHSSYFDRYFAFGIPARDIRDADVREDLTHLTHTGQWQPTSVIRDSLADPERQKLVRMKILGNLDVLADATSECAARAAATLTHELLPEDSNSQRGLLLFGGWNIVLYPLLGHAICSADADAASAIVDDYADTFGIPTTVDVLSSPTNFTGIDVPTITDATGNVRKEVLDRCMVDLTTELAPDQQSTHSILSFFHYLDDDLWKQLSERAQQLLTNDNVTLAGLGARFVSVSQQFDTWNITFHETEFAELIPQHLWNTYELPAPDDQKYEPGTLAHRKMVAANWMRTVVDNSDT